MVLGEGEGVVVEPLVHGNQKGASLSELRLQAANDGN